jgi:hypothetical protein
VEGCRRGPAIGPQPTAQDRLFYEIVSRGGCRDGGTVPKAYFCYSEVRMHILEHEPEDSRFQYVQVERRGDIAI